MVVGKSHRQTDQNIVCHCARTNDVTDGINYKLPFLNRKLITEGILSYSCHKSTFEDQLNVCNFILLIFACVVYRKVHVHSSCSFFTLETVGFPEW